MEVSEDTARAARFALQRLHDVQCFKVDEQSVEVCYCDTAKAWRELARLLGER